MKIPANLTLTTLTIATLLSCTTLSFAHNYQSTQVAEMGNSSSPASKQSSLPFSDISQNVYKPEILQAFELKIVQGFPDGTFRPSQPVTREQAVSMIVDAINLITPVDLNATPTRPVRPFTDVPSDRWSAAKIAWAQWNIWPAGTPTGRKGQEVCSQSASPSGLHGGSDRADAQLREERYQITGLSDLYLIK